MWRTNAYSKKRLPEPKSPQNRPDSQPCLARPDNRQDGAECQSASLPGVFDAHARHLLPRTGRQIAPEGPCQPGVRSEKLACGHGLGTQTGRWQPGPQPASGRTGAIARATAPIVSCRLENGQQRRTHQRLLRSGSKAAARWEAVSWDGCAGRHRGSLICCVRTCNIVYSRSVMVVGRRGNPNPAQHALAEVHRSALTRAAQCSKQSARSVLRGQDVHRVSSISATKME